MSCPSCGSAKVRGLGKRYTHYPMGIVAIIGLPFAMLHQLSAPHEFRCEGCGLDFTERTRNAQVARVFLFILGIGVSLLVLVAIVTIIIAQSR